MSQINRLSNGGRIDRNKVLSFTFNGQTYKGFEGDSLAAALLANGVDIIGRGFKYSASGCRPVMNLSPAPSTRRRHADETERLRASASAYISRA